MKIAVYQGASMMGDIDLAFDVIETVLSAVSSAGGKMVVFPELFLPGYNQKELHHSTAQPEGGPWESKLSALAKKTKCGLAIGWAEKKNSCIYNTVSCFTDTGEKLVHYRKIQLFGAVEKSTFATGDTYRTFSLNGYKAAVLICYDVEFAHHVHALKELGVELLLVPTANPARYNNVPQYIVPARAAENRMIIAYANYCGREKDLVYGGKSLIVGPDAGMLAQAGEGEALLIANLDVVKNLDTDILSTQSADRKILA